MALPQRWRITINTKTALMRWGPGGVTRALAASPSIRRRRSGRRGFITKLAHSGISSKVIMEFAGHKHLSATQRYIDVNDETSRAAVVVL